MSRTALAVLGLVATSLVSGAPGGDGARREIAEVPHACFDVDEVAEILARVNPALSSQELRRIGAAVMRCHERYELDPQLVTAVLLVESSARPWVRSPKGAVGLMQVMPHMLAPLDMAGNPTTIESNIEAGCLILADNIRRLGEENGISAYFWGSEIRGVSYLQRVREARATVRRLSES